MADLVSYWRRTPPQGEALAILLARMGVELREDPEPPPTARPIASPDDAQSLVDALNALGVKHGA